MKTCKRFRVPVFFLVPNISGLIAGSWQRLAFRIEEGERAVNLRRIRMFVGEFGLGMFLMG